MRDLEKRCRSRQEGPRALAGETKARGIGVLHGELPGIDPAGAAPLPGREHDRAHAGGSGLARQEPMAGRGEVRCGTFEGDRWLHRAAGREESMNDVRSTPCASALLGSMSGTAPVRNIDRGGMSERRCGAYARPSPDQRLPSARFALTAPDRPREDGTAAIGRGARASRMRRITASACASPTDAVRRQRSANASTSVARIHAAGEFRSRRMFASSVRRPKRTTSAKLMPDRRPRVVDDPEVHADVVALTARGVGQHAREAQGGSALRCGGHFAGPQALTGESAAQLLQAVAHLGSEAAKDDPGGGHAGVARGPGGEWLRSRARFGEGKARGHDHLDHTMGTANSFRTPAVSRGGARAGDRRQRFGKKRRKARSASCGAPGWTGVRPRRGRGAHCRTPARP